MRNTQENDSFLAILLWIALLLHIAPWPPDEFPETLSMNIISVPEMPPGAVISFITDAEAARITYPFHWDLLTDIPLKDKQLFTVRLDPAYFTQLASADRIVIQGYHGKRDGQDRWSNHTFTDKRFSTWNITGMKRTNSHVETLVTIQGPVEVSTALFWTTIPQTRVRFPSSRRGQWMARINTTGGYWPYAFDEPLFGTRAVSTDLPPIILGDLPAEAVRSILEKKIRSFNFIPAQDGNFTVITVSASLNDLTDDLRKDLR